MNWFLKTFTYGVGKKLIMGATGLFFVIFLIEHAAGNFLLFANDNGKEYNLYSHTLTHNVIIGPIVKLIEIFLFSSFIFHIVYGILLWVQNKRSRSIQYIVNKPNQNSQWTSRNMMLSGAIIFLFLVIHLGTFFIPYRFTDNIPDLYQKVYNEFKNPWFTGFYVFAMVFLCLHLQHGFFSAFQTLGLRTNRKYIPFLKIFGLIFSIVICASFASQPLYFLFFDTLHNLP
jgi:succinate dehydrogenase / fumarate reductase, cytochrome b subunit